MSPWAMSEKDWAKMSSEEQTKYRAVAYLETDSGIPEDCMKSKGAEPAPKKVCEAHALDPPPRRHGRGPTRCVRVAGIDLRVTQ